ncbi:10350_t:CDS:10 [Acaulospora colombiana]|uniref:10350_t:CDS:1 n=1 Tax=Acaulospora colombiana TaxID=27376 RepID=A0ACA9KG69_9GLOM|nr:10350_t:CDS:10 [Acaulospora colombiana]
MGWDAFGLPAENAAMERGIHPADWTKSNIASMKIQMEKILTDFDWDREVTTCYPEYYKWTQYLFLQMYKAGLAYQKEAVVNWDPIDQTVLANEQVDSEGRSWRSGAKVECRKLKQWFLKITRFVEPLLNDLDTLDKWPDRVKQMQRFWIGKSRGAEFDFVVNLSSHESPYTIKVFTSRPDTIFGVQYLAISMDHPLISKEYFPQETLSSVLEFVEIFEHQGTRLKDEKVGKGVYATHPITGSPVPIYVAPYVVSDYGTGAVMGVPAHDERDWEFFKQNLLDSEGDVKRVVEPPEQRGSLKLDPSSNRVYTSLGILTDDCGKYAGLSSKEAMKRIVHDAQEAGPFSSQKASELLPVNIYGMFFLGNDTNVANKDEPFKQLITQGMVHGKTFKDPKSGRFLKPEEIDLTDPSNPIQISTGLTPVVTFEKMSKSKYNGVDPETTINNYGADATRLHMLYKAPVSEVLEWEEASIVGMQRWILRVRRLVENVVSKGLRTIDSSAISNLSLMSKAEKETYRIINITIKEVTAALEEGHSFNTAISSLIKLTNHLIGISPNLSEKTLQERATVDSNNLSLYEYGVRALIKMISPMAPAIGEEFWEILNKDQHYWQQPVNDVDTVNLKSTIFDESWPKVDEKGLNVEEVTCVVQVGRSSRFVCEDLIVGN